MKVSKYDAARDCFYEVDVDGLEAEMAAYGFTPEEIAPKIEALQQSVIDNVANTLGIEGASLTVEDGTVTVTGTVPETDPDVEPEPVDPEPVEEK